MSDRATSDIGPFAIVPEWILRADVSDLAVRVFGMLGRYADRDGAAFPSRRTLADAIRTSRSSIDRAMRELVAIDAVKVEPRHGSAGDQTSNLYRLRYAGPSSRLVTPLVTGDDAPLTKGDHTPYSPVRHRTKATLTRSPVSEETGGAPTSPAVPILPYDRPRRQPRSALLRGPDPRCYRDGPGFLGVPHLLHAQFLEMRIASGMAQDAAVRELDAFYERWTIAYTEGDRRDRNQEPDQFKFWKARHAETWPTVGGTGDRAGSVSLSVPSAEATRQMLERELGV